MSTSNPNDDGSFLSDRKNEENANSKIGKVTNKPKRKKRTTDNIRRFETSHKLEPFSKPVRDERRAYGPPVRCR